jgi:hypothetical protein
MERDYFEGCSTCNCASAARKTYPESVRPLALAAAFSFLRSSAVQYTNMPILGNRFVARLGFPFAMKRTNVYT